MIDSELARDRPLTDRREKRLFASRATGLFPPVPGNSPVLCGRRTAFRACGRGSPRGHGRCFQGEPTMPSQMRSSSAIRNVVGCSVRDSPRPPPTTTPQPDSPPTASAAGECWACLSRARSRWPRRWLMRAATNRPCWRPWPASGRRRRTPRCRVRSTTRSSASPLSSWKGPANNTTASYLGDPFVDLPRIGGTSSRTSSDASWKPYASTLAAAGLSQEIFDFGRIAAEAAAADARVTDRRARRRHSAPRHRIERRGGVLRGARGQVDPPGVRGRLSAVAGAPQLRQRRGQVGPPLADRADARRGGS